VSEIVSSANALSVTWAKAVDYPGSYGSDYLVEVSSTLQPDSWTPADPADLSGDITYTFPAALGQHFVRLKITYP